MLEKTVFTTVEQLQEELEKRVSKKRYLHSVGVAQTTEMLLEHYHCSNYEKTWNGFSAGYFCGISHDFAREMTDDQLVAYCRENGIPLTEEELASPVITHGKVSAHLVRGLVGDYPESWVRAIDLHTVGDVDMDDLALALFAADFIEPTRVFLTNEKRAEYIAHDSLEGCVYHILCDMMEHWKNKGQFSAAQGSVRLRKQLEEKLGV